MLNKLATDLRAAFLERFAKHPFSPCRLFLSATNMKMRAITRHACAPTAEEAWDKALTALAVALEEADVTASMLRADWVVSTVQTTWIGFQNLVHADRRNYFRQGIALDADWRIAFTEMELNANAMLYKPGNSSRGTVVVENCADYCKRRFGCDWPLLAAESPVSVFTVEGVFVQQGEEPLPITGQGLDAGRRDICACTPELFLQCARTAADYLAGQCDKHGRFHYGWFSCFDKRIPTYNTLRHISTTWSLLQAYAAFKTPTLRSAIQRSIDYIVKTFVRHCGEAIYFEDVESSEIKLGSSGCMLIMLARYAELINAKKYLPLMRCVARGILAMQEEDGSFVHVLNSKDFSLKERSRIVYYDGEAVFGLLRLYSLTKDKQLLEASQRAFDRFIATDHWKNHDHWLSYSVNELTRYAPQHRYFEFGIRNFNGYLNFVATRDTAYPTLLELMLAANEMLHRLEAMPEMADLCSIVNRDAFVHALHRRAYLLLNGYFWPEFAMFFANPAKIVGSFFIKHHAFRVRIDDVQHYISGFIGYAELLRSMPAGIITRSVDKGQQPIIFFGGDVTLGRRMHRADAKPLAHVTYMQQADVRIVNLECVIANGGSQGVIKGEGGPYYFHARPEQTHILVDAGIDVVATANNHSGDYGPQALLEQREYLDKAGIAHAGSGTCLDEASKPAFVRAGALTLALFSVDTTQKHFAANQEKPGTLYLPITQPDRWKEVLGPRIAEARQCAHLVFVAVHWGANNASVPTEDERAIGRLLIDLDCDAVLGTSAHIVQGVEVYRGRPILHDAGDFLFDSREKVSRPGGCFLLETGRQGVTGVRFYPLDICYCHTQPATGNRAREMCEQFAKSCHALWTKAVVSAEEACVTIPLPKPPERAQPAHPWNGTYTSHAIPALESPHSTWIAAEVPEDAAIAPVQLGPLTLVGCRIPPNRLTMTQRQMLWVETWWMVQEPVHTSCSISLLGVPLRKCTMPPFGNGMEHEGCDWMWPTNRWKPGTIYREWFGLRPPNQPRMVSSDLQLEIRVTCGTQTFGPYIFPTTCALRLPNSPYYRGDVPESALHSLPRQCWNAQQLADVTGGTWSPPPPEGWFVSAVVRGSKQISMVPQPVLYVASTSKDLDYHEQFSKLSKFWDSHKNLPVLIKKTAGAIVSHVVANLPPEYPQLVVSDPIKAIIELGLTARRRFKGKVIAITGTVGKSSVAAMLVHVLRKRHTVHTTYDNYNSRVGVPVVLASLPQDTDFAVIEIAQSALWMRRGPITLDICPDVSVITEVGLSQTTNASIRSVMDVARFKSRVFHGLTDNGIAVFSDHLEGFDHILSTARTHAARSIICGSGQHATSQITHIQDTANGHHVTASIEGIPIEFDVTPHGMPSIRNTMLVLGVLAAVGIAPQEGIEALKSYTPLYGRLEYSDCLWEGRNIRVIDDSWNAEVLSFKRALDAAPYMKREKQGRLIAVLGRIVHLGAKAKELHQALREPVLEAKPDLVLTHGDEMRHLRAVLPEAILGPHFSNVGDLVAFLGRELCEDDTVLIKGSRRDSDFGELGLILTGEAKAHAIWDASTLTSVTGGSWVRQPADGWSAGGVCIWNSSFRTGDLVCMRGTHKTLWYSDASFVERKGANVAGVICDSKDSYDGPLPMLLVEDVQRVARHMGIYAREHFAGTVIAVTGSCGKSTTVAMLGHTLQHFGGAACSRDNQNMAIGILWNMACMRRDVAFWNIEVAVGAIRQNGGQIASPHVVIVTSVGESHLADHGTVRGVAEEKSKLLDAVHTGGTAILNMDMPYFTAFYERARSRDLNIITFGTATGATIRFCDNNADYAQIAIGDKKYILPCSAVPLHHRTNALAVLAVCLARDIPIEAAIARLATYRTLPGRGTCTDLVYQGKRLRIVDESWNANPLSMKAALESFARSSTAGQRVVILGDMLELGANEIAFHTNLAPFIERMEARVIILIGELMHHLYAVLQQSCGKSVLWFQNVQQFLENVSGGSSVFEDGDHIFIKSSHGTQLFQIVPFLKR